VAASREPMLLRQGNSRASFDAGSRTGKARWSHAQKWCRAEVVLCAMPTANGARTLQDSGAPAVGELVGSEPLHANLT
jgi:hypothetical protein